MIPPGALVVLDTNVLLALVRGKALGEPIDREFALRTRPERPLVSVVAIGEALALAYKFNWGEAKREMPRSQLGAFVPIGLLQSDIIERYAVLSAHCEANGLSLSDNDRWIAATAGSTGAWLLTTDKDFLPLDPDFIQLAWIDPAAAP